MQENSSSSDKFGFGTNEHAKKNYECKLDSSIINQEFFEREIVKVFNFWSYRFNNQKFASQKIIASCNFISEKSKIHRQNKKKINLS